MEVKRGRPIIKKDRVKIGLSLEGQSNYVLNKISEESGKTKSRIIEEAISLYYERYLSLEKEKNNKNSLSAMDNLRTYLSANKRV